MSGSTVAIRIADIVVHPETQVRVRTDPATVKRYAQAMRVGAEFPPIEVAQFPPGAASELEGARVLIDGFHRVEAMQRLGIGETRAVVREVTTFEEARWLAGKANQTHGRPYRPKERREVFRAFVEAAQHLRDGEPGELKSYREMARELGGVSYNTVRNWMRADFPAVFQEMGDAEGAARGGLPEPEPASRTFTRVAIEGVEQAAAALPSISDPEDRRELLAEIDQLRAAIGEVPGGTDLDF
jgi:transposase